MKKASNVYYRQGLTVLSFQPAELILVNDKIIVQSRNQENNPKEVYVEVRIDEIQKFKVTSGRLFLYANVTHKILFADSVGWSKKGKGLQQKRVFSIDTRAADPELMSWVDELHSLNIKDATFNPIKTWRAAFWLLFGFLATIIIAIALFI